MSAVALNVSTFDQDAGGYVTVWPRGQARPGTSSLTYGPWRMQTQMVLATLSGDGWTSVYNGGGNIHMLFDVVGYYIEGSGASFVPVTSTRVIDTRYHIPGWGVGPITEPLAPDTNTAIKLTGIAGVPETDVSAVMVNAIAGGTSSTGWLNFWASGDPEPGTVSHTYYPNEDSANLVMAKVGADGKAIVRNYSGSSMLVIDVVGYFATPPPPTTTTSTSTSTSTTTTTAPPPTTTTTVPPSPPGAPTNVVATPGDSSASVGWTASEPNGSPIIRYTVTVTPGGRTTTVDGNQTSATLTELTNGTTYTFQIMATNAGGDSPLSEPSNAVTPEPNPTNDPLLRAGDAPFFSHDAYPLNDRLSAKVNLGTGNLMISAADMTIPMVGGARTLGRTYNSLGLAPNSTGTTSPLFGPGWRFSEAPDHRLRVNSDGSVTYLSGTGHAHLFAAGTYTPPLGTDAALVKNADGTYKLTFTPTATVLNFRSDGLMSSEVDRNGNTIAFAYPAAGGYPTTILGTAGTAPGNTVTLTYGGPMGKISAMSQTAGGTTRTVSYAYEAYLTSRDKSEPESDRMAGMPAAGWWW